LLARLAGGQWGVVVRWQLLEARVTVAAIDYALRTGRLRQVHRGVYMLGGAAVCIEARWVAAVLACGRARCSATVMPRRCGGCCSRPGGR
jgi:hypothetical protein